MNVKTLFLGVALIILVGIGGLVYRNAVEHPSRPIACPADAKVCPDGTSVGRSGPFCEFALCPSIATSSVPALSTSTSTATSTL